MSTVGTEPAVDCGMVVSKHTGFVNNLLVCIANCCLPWWLWLLCVVYTN